MKNALHTYLNLHIEIEHAFKGLFATCTSWVNCLYVLSKIFPIWLFIFFLMIYRRSLHISDRQKIFSSSFFKFLPTLFTPSPTLSPPTRKCLVTLTRVPAFALPFLDLNLLTDSLSCRDYFQ